MPDDTFGPCSSPLSLWAALVFDTARGITAPVCRCVCVLGRNHRHFPELAEREGAWHYTPSFPPSPPTHTLPRVHHTQFTSRWPYSSL